jgi:arylformamidase
MADTDSAARAKPGNFARNHSAPRIIDLSIDLDAKTFHMRSYDGFKKNMEFDVEVIKDYPGGLGQIVRGVHMRLHAGSHIDAPSHMLQGGLDMHEVPLAAFIGDAVVADVRHRGGMEAITVADLEKAVADVLQPGDRILLRTDVNETYDGSPEWIARSPYIDPPAIDWMGENGVSLVGFDFYHGNGSREANPTYSTSHHCADSGVLTMPYIHNLGSITRRRFTLIAPPLKVIDVEASPVRAVALED